MSVPTNYREASVCELCKHCIETGCSLVTLTCSLHNFNVDNHSVCDDFED